MNQMPEKTREVITKYLGDLHALESHGLQAIARQVEEIEQSEHPEALRAVQDFKRTIESHIQAIESRLTALGGSPTSPVKDAASAVAGVAAGLYNKTRTEKVSKSIRDDYTFISHSAIAYLMFHTTAMALGDEESAQVADRGYRDAARMAMEIDRIMPSLVIQELRQDGAQARNVEEHCRRLIHEAWNGQSSGMSPSMAGRYATGMQSSGMHSGGMSGSSPGMAGSSSGMSSSPPSGSSGKAGSSSSGMSGGSTGSTGGSSGMSGRSSSTGSSSSTSRGSESSGSGSRSSGSTGSSGSSGSSSSSSGTNKGPSGG